jgi:hypothetical protein
MTFQVDPDKVVLGVLSASLVLGLHLIYVNVVTLQNAPRGAVRVPRAMVAASIFQFLNQVGFVFFSNANIEGWVSPDQESNLCYLMYIVGDVIYVCFQMLATSVIIYKGTVMFTSYRSTSKKISPEILRACLYTVMSVASLLALFSGIKKEIILENHQCIPLYHPILNSTEKIIFCALYFLILIFFCLPVMHHLKDMGVISFLRDSTSSWKLAVRSMTLRISVAVLGYLITAILSFTSGWWHYVIIEFTVENYLCLLASTFARNARAAPLEGSSFFFESQLGSNSIRINPTKGPVSASVTKMSEY